jgi:hypothetical protein
LDGYNTINQYIPSGKRIIMPNPEILDQIAAEFGPEQNVAVGKWFGKPCMSVGKKVFVILWGKDLAFKLNGEAHANAMKLEGAHLFDPRGAGNPMKEWVQIPVTQAAAWTSFAKLAFHFVSAE